MKNNPFKLQQIKDNVRTLFIRPAGSRFEYVDGLRAFSILWVIAFHCYFILGYVVLKPEAFGELSGQHWIYRFLRHGSLGVDVFFAISGFLIGFFVFQEFKKTKAIKIKHFYIKRIFRLLPVYVVSLCLWALIRPDNFHNVWANILYVNNFLDIRNQHVGWSWSLAIEEQFYTVFPWFALLLLTKLKRPLTWMIGLFVFSFAIRFLLIRHFNIQFPIDNPFGERQDEFLVFFNELYIKPYSRYGSILIGVITSYAFVFTDVIRFLENSRVVRTLLLLFGLAVFLFFTVIVSLPEGQGEPPSQAYFNFILVSYRNILSLAICGLVLYSFTSQGQKNIVTRFLKAKIWYPIAQLSYSAYLIHFMVIAIMYKAQKMDEVFSLERFLWNMPLAFLITGIVSAFLFIFIEMPFIRERSRLLK